MAFGPIQLLVIGFEEGRFQGEILPELQRLREADVIRIVDLLFLRCDDDGEVDIVELSDLGVSEQRELGAIAGALVGFGAAGEDGALLGAVARGPKLLRACGTKRMSSISPRPLSPVRRSRSPSSSIAGRFHCAAPFDAPADGRSPTRGFSLRTSSHWARTSPPRWRRSNRDRPPNPPTGS